MAPDLANEGFIPALPALARRSRRHVRRLVWLPAVLAVLVLAAPAGAQDPGSSGEHWGGGAYAMPEPPPMPEVPPMPDAPAPPAPVEPPEAVTAPEPLGAVAAPAPPASAPEPEPPAPALVAPAPPSAPVNLNVDIRILSPGDDGDVRQSIDMPQAPQRNGGGRSAPRGSAPDSAAPAPDGADWNWTWNWDCGGDPGSLSTADSNWEWNWDCGAGGRPPESLAAEVLEMVERPGIELPSAPEVPAPTDLAPDRGGRPAARPSSSRHGGSSSVPVGPVLAPGSPLTSGAPATALSTRVTPRPRAQDPPDTDRPRPAASSGGNGWPLTLTAYAAAPAAGSAAGGSGAAFFLLLAALGGALVVLAPWARGPLSSSYRKLSSQLGSSRPERPG